MKNLKVKAGDLLKIAWDPEEYFIVEFIREERGFWVVKDTKTKSFHVCRPSMLRHSELYEN